ncbi:hypothetical protein AACH06_03230 [Ideonella sp. DXS29W]|uniref:Uncharacterized protein n=1 Tax=Ideonella lacteola TaxID=2984193 RepID=A0ABU9BK15_9BURK
MRTALLASAAVAVLWLMPSQASIAAPRVPSDDHEVIERLPTRLPGAAPARTGAGQRAALRQQAAQAQPNLSLALAAAREAIDQARRSGDPRDWGQAQAVLAPWWKDAEPPGPVRLLRATIRQGLHDFVGALADLDALLASPLAVGGPPALRRAAFSQSASPALALHAQAELTRSSIHQVQGRYAEARLGCERLAGDAYAALGDGVRTAAQACLVELGQLQGRLSARQADAALSKLGAADDPWLALLRAELAQRTGDRRADGLFRAASAGEAPSLYALATYADWLLDQHRPADVVRLLRGYEAADALLLRIAIARHQLKDESASELATQLQARFDAALARGDRSHAREQARFMLDLRHDAPQALVLAQQNWSWQREPADALLLLRAAAAAGEPQAAEPVRRWAREQGFVDVRWPSISAAPVRAATPTHSGSAS